MSKCARLTRKTYVQKAEIVQTHSVAMRRSSNSGRFLTAFRTGFSALRSRSVGRMFYRYFADYELKDIVSVPILKYYLPKKANPEDWFKTRVLLNQTIKN